ncbi:hypothetical protein ACFX13_000275 [Malus domestica]
MLLWEKQQREIEQTKDLIHMLGAGANSGRASSAEKKLEKLQEDDQWKGCSRGNK